MSKRLLSVFLVLCMLASVFGTVAFAAEPIYTTSAINFGYVDGSAWTDATALEAGKTLTSKIEVSKTGDAENMIFALVVYDANKLIEADSSTQSVAGDTVTFEASVELPADVTNTHVVAVLWDNVTDMNAIANSSVFPKGSTELEYITVDGEALEGFDPSVKTYTVLIDVNRTDRPIVDAKPIDGGSRVSVAHPTRFPGKSVITVTAADGTEDYYTVNYALKGGIEGYITNVGAGADAKAFNAPVPALVTALDVGTKCWSDRNNAEMVYKMVADELKGLPYIHGALNWVNGGSAPYCAPYKGDYLSDWYTFDLTKTGTVYVLLQGAGSKAQRFIDEGGWTRENSSGTDYFAQAFTNGNVNYSVMLSKTIEVPEGESVTVTVPNLSDGYIPLIAVSIGNYEDIPDIPEEPVQPDVPQAPEGYVEGMSISNDNIEIRTAARTGWNKPINQDGFGHQYRKTISLDGADTKTITLNIENKPYQKGIIILRPVADGLEDKTVLVNSDGSAIEWVDDREVARAYDYENYPEYSLEGVTYGKQSSTDVVTLGSGKAFKAFKEMFASDEKYVSGARTHYSRSPIGGGVAMGSILPEWENCNYIVFNNYYGDDAQLASETVTFTVNQDVEVIFVTNGAGVSVMEDGVDSASWTAEVLTGIQRYWMNWIDSITVAYLIYNGYITETDLIGNYSTVQGVSGICQRNRAAWAEFEADWKEAYDATPIHGIQIKESDKAVTGFVNDSSTYSHELFLYCWKEAAGGDVTPATSTLLSALAIDGKPLEGFGPTVINYTVTLTSATDITNITATTEDSEATATVDTSADGVIRITVSAEGALDTVYTVNYTLVDYGNIKHRETYNDAAVNWGGAVAVGASNLQVGDLCYSDRNNTAMVWSKVDEALAGKDWIKGALNWPNGGNNSYALMWRDTTAYPDFYTFDLYKSARVMIVSNSTAKSASLTDNGYKLTTNSDSYLIGYTAATTRYNYMYSKYVEVTDGAETISIPNFGGVSCFVILDFEAESPEAEAGAASLTALSVNGTAVEGFAPSTYEYTVAIPANQADFPEITYTKGDEAAAVEVANPTEFPGKAVITVSKDGEETKTYTITYTAETKVSDMYVMNNNVIPAAYSSTGEDWTYPATATHYPKYVQNGFAVDMTAWGDRSYKVTAIGEGYEDLLEGKDVIKGSVESWNANAASTTLSVKTAFQSDDNLDWLNFKVTRDATVRVFKITNKDEAKLTAKGFTAEPVIDASNPYFIIVRDSNNQNKHIYQYTRKVTAGELVTVPNARESSANAYTVIIDYDTYDSLEQEEEEPEVPAISTKLSALTVDGTAVDGFNADTLTYSVELPYGTTSATVAATAADAQAAVTIAQAAEIPGTATVTVSATGSEDTVYTINFTVAEPVNTDPVQNITMKESYNGETIAWNTSVATYLTNLQVGDHCYSDRTYSSAMVWSKVADAFAGKDWIRGGLDWANGGTKTYTTVWKLTDVVDYYTFELHKSAEVSIIVNTVGKKEYLLANGWKYETDSSSYLIGYTNTAVAYNHKFSKYFDASEGYVTIAVPNMGSTGATVIIDYDAAPTADTSLSDLTVDGVTVEGFSPVTNTYTVQVPAGSEVPVVGYTLADSNASAVAVQAAALPGTATVTVSGFDGQEDNVYTINFLEYVERKISFSDLEARGAQTHTGSSVSVLYNNQSNAKYAYKKTYDVAEGETKTITLSAAGLTNQFSSIVVRPTTEGADKNVIVTADGGELTWNDYKVGVAGTNGVSVSAYDYQNGGDEEFDTQYATYTQFSTNGVSVTVDGAAKTAWVVDKMHYSDDMFVNGAPSVTDRNPSQSGVCWIDFPAEWENCNYITFGSGSIPGSTGAEITFTVNAPVEVIVFTANAGAAVKDSEDTENWASEDVATVRRYMHGVDSLSIAYMIKKGYMKESDVTRTTGIAFAGYAGSVNAGSYIRRYDALIKMEEDMGANYGVGIKAENLEATGFINEGEDAIDYYIRDYTYQDFLDAWVDE